jgi:ankyrin repeat protein
MNFATYGEHIDVVKVLLANGAKVNARCEGFSPLQYAAYKGDVELCRLLLDHGANVNEMVIEPGWPGHGRTPLHWAVMGGHVEVVRLLLSRGAKVNIKDEDGKTALDLAREKRDREIIALLEKAGAAQ